MPRHDAYHEIVKRALEKDGWVITHDPLTINYKGLHLYVDLGAEKEVASSRIAVEIKVFGRDSEIDDFEKAAGQYSIYRDAIEGSNLKRKLFLAIALKVYNKFFQVPAIQEYVERHHMHLLVFDHETEEVVEWITQRS